MARCAGRFWYRACARPSQRAHEARAKTGGALGVEARVGAAHDVPGLARILNGVVHAPASRCCASGEREDVWGP